MSKSAHANEFKYNYCSENTSKSVFIFLMLVDKDRTLLPAAAVAVVGSNYKLQNNPPRIVYIDDNVTACSCHFPPQLLT